MPRADISTPRLDAYVSATTRSMVILSLSVIPMYVVESLLSNAGNSVSWIFLIGGILVQITMAADLAIRMVLSRRPLGYLLRHKLDAAAIVVPPLRAVGQVAGVRGVLRRKGVLRFTVFSGLLVSAAALVVYGAERGNPEATIDSVDDAIWWAIVTTTTIGYGDVVPITREGRAMAVILMMLGIVILAVATANVSAYFVDGRADRNNNGKADTIEVLERLARLETSIANIEAHLLGGPHADDSTQDRPPPADG